MIKTDENWGLKRDGLVMYSYDAVVRYSETGGNIYTNAASIANYLQDCAILHSEEVGISLKYLAEHHRAWFLVSWQIDIDRYPVLGEQIQIRTWAYDFKGSIGYRNIEIVDGQGQSIVKASSLWSYVDTEAMRPVRIEEAVAAAYPLFPKLDMEYASRKIRLYDNHEPIAERTVMSYQIDSNNHMNNEAYIALALEYADDISDIRRVRAEYRKQFVKGDTIIVKKAVCEEGQQLILCDREEAIRCIVLFER